MQYMYMYTYEVSTYSIEFIEAIIKKAARNVKYIICDKSSLFFEE